MTPDFASKKENENKVRQTLYEKYYGNPVDSKQNFKVNDLVRIYKWKGHFEKGYETNFSKEIFRISEVLHTNPITYKIKALDGEDIIGSFYNDELVLHTNKWRPKACRTLSVISLR